MEPREPDKGYGMRALIHTTILAIIATLACGTVLAGGASAAERSRKATVVDEVEADPQAHPRGG